MRPKTAATVCAASSTSCVTRPLMKRAAERPEPQKFGCTFCTMMDEWISNDIDLFSRKHFYGISSEVGTVHGRFDLSLFSLLQPLQCELEEPYHVDPHQTSNNPRNKHWIKQSIPQPLLIARFCSGNKQARKRACCLHE